VNFGRKCDMKEGNSMNSERGKKEKSAEGLFGWDTKVRLKFGFGEGVGSTC
jgi:hypothetical protein